MIQRGSQRISSVVALSALAVAVCLATAPSALAAPAACGDLVTSDLTLENDLLGCPGDGLTVVADDVTIDLNGHTVSGLATGVGIASAGVSNLSISNGIISGFAEGINTFDGSNIFLGHLTVRDNTTGIRLDTGTRAVVSRNHIINNQGNGILAGIPGGSVVRNNIIAWNGLNGLVGAEDSVQLVEGNLASHNGASGVLLGDSVARVANNKLSNNGAYGLRITERISSFVQHYVVVDNVADKNGVGGIFFTCTSCVVPPLGDPPIPPIAIGNAAKNNQDFQCRFEAVFFTLTFVYDELTCARTHGQAKTAFVGRTAPLRHS